jgi:ribonuclease HI
MFLTPEQMSVGVAIYCDGGSRNNQSKELRSGYGSFKVARNGQLIESSFAGEKCIQHRFEYGNTTNSVAECETMLRALTYASELRARGHLDGVRICCDSQNAILAATTDIKKPAPHLTGLYAEIRKLSTDMRNYVQVVKIGEAQMKAILGH